MASGQGTKDSSFSEDISDNTGDDEKENRAAGARKPTRKQRENQVVMDKGLKDVRSFTQQLFTTATMKMGDWIGMPPPSKAFNFFSVETPADANESAITEELAKIKLPTNPLEIMDMGQVSRDSESVSQSRHQEILQHPPRKRTMSMKDAVTPTPHSNAKAKMMLPPPVPHHRPPQPRRSSTQHTPSRGGDKHTPIFEAPEFSIPPQGLKVIDEKIAEALAKLCLKSAGSGGSKDAEIFACQSLFYIFSNPEAILASFGGIGSGETVGLDTAAVDGTLEVIFSAGWGKLVKRTVSRGLIPAFSKKTPPREAAALLIIALHILANGVVRDDEIFANVTALRASGVASTATQTMPDIGFEDETALRLMKRILRGMDAHGPESEVHRHVRDYMVRCHQTAMEAQRRELEQALGKDLAKEGLRSIDSWSFNRCALEWTRTVFVQHWEGRGFVKKDSLAGSCLRMFQLLHGTDSLSEAVFPTRSVGERLDLYECGLGWFNKTAEQSETDYHLLDFPYILHSEHLINFFRAINMDTMKEAYENVLAQNSLTQKMKNVTEVAWHTLVAHTIKMLSMFCVLTIRRSHLVEDTFNQLIHRERREVLRPLKLRFLDGEEDGQDLGGVTQEFFVILMQEIFNPDYGLFVTDSQTQMSWFNESSLDGVQKFEMVGVILGLALYNGVTLPINLPLAFYMKLLGQTPKLDDIGDRWPGLQRGLRDLLTWEDGDVGDIIGRTYEYSYDCFGTVRSIDISRAGETGIQYLEQPIPRLAEQQQTTPSPPQQSWLGPIVDEIPGSEHFMEGLADILRNAPPDFNPWAMRPYSEQTRYPVTYTDLNEDNFSDDSDDSELLDAADVPLPPDEPADFTAERPESSYERAARELEETSEPQQNASETSEEGSFTPEERAPSPVPDAPLVTNANRHAYVKDYLLWLHTRSVSRQYTALERGIFSILPARTLAFFTPPQLQLLLQGSPTISVDDLEANTKYEDGYNAEHRVIKEFWSIVRGYDEEQKRRLLEFVTSSPRVPVGGMGKLVFWDHEEWG